MLRRSLAALLSPLALAACQPPELELRAMFLGNALAFTAAQESQRSSSACWSDVAVVDDRGHAVWAADGPEAGECGAAFPLVYGRAPAGARTVEPAARLEPGRLYLVTGHTDLDAIGAFVLVRVGDRLLVHNLPPDHAQVRALQRRWWQRRQGDA